MPRRTGSEPEQVEYAEYIKERIATGEKVERKMKGQVQRDLPDSAGMQIVLFEDGELGYWFKRTLPDGRVSNLKFVLSTEAAASMATNTLSLLFPNDKS